ncbi:MAG: M23 family metallopeptidase [Clostridiales bacterium]|nr:M23 family metallopeptidase [Clostridiales bacterium]
MKTYQSSTKENKKNFFKRHRNAIIAILSIIAVVVVIALAVVFSLPDSKPAAAPTVKPPATTNEVKTVMPMNGAAMGMGYSYDSLKWWDTLEIWKIHPAVDFVGDGDVLAIRDGKVKDVEKTSLEGNVVTVEHDDGYISVYKSLDDDIAVKVGDTVRAGDKIGKAGKSVAELNTGAHLHLEVKKDGKYVDPMTLLPDNDDK